MIDGTRIVGISEEDLEADKGKEKDMIDKIDMEQQQENSREVLRDMKEGCLLKELKEEEEGNREGKEDLKKEDHRGGECLQEDCHGEYLKSHQEGLITVVEKRETNLREETPRRKLLQVKLLILRRVQRKRREIYFLKKKSCIQEMNTNL